MPQPAFNLVVEPPWTAADSEPTQMILVKSPAHSDSQFTGTDFRQYPNHQSVLQVSCDPRCQKIWPDDMSVKSIGVKLRCTGRSSEASVPGLGGTFCKLTPIWVKGTITSLVGPSQSGDTLPRLGEVSRVTLPVDAEFAVQETLICNPARTPGDSLMMANEPAVHGQSPSSNEDHMNGSTPQSPDLGRLLFLNYPPKSNLFHRSIPPLDKSYTLNQEGDGHATVIHDETPEDPWRNPLSVRVTLFVPTASINEALDRAGLESIGVSGVDTLRIDCGPAFPARPFIPGQDGLAQYLTYDDATGRFTHSAIVCHFDDARLPDLDLAVRAHVRADWTIDPARYPFLQSEMSKGTDVVVKPQSFMGECLESHPKPVTDLFKGGQSPRLQ